MKMGPVFTVSIKSNLHIYASQIANILPSIYLQICASYIRRQIINVKGGTKLGNILPPINFQFCFSNVSTCSAIPRMHAYCLP